MLPPNGRLGGSHSRWRGRLEAVCAAPDSAYSMPHLQLCFFDRLSPPSLKAADPTEAAAQLGRGQERAQGAMGLQSSPVTDTTICQTWHGANSVWRRNRRKRKRSEKNSCNCTRHIILTFCPEVSIVLVTDRREEKRQEQKKEWKNLTEKAAAWPIPCLDVVSKLAALQPSVSGRARPLLFLCSRQAVLGHVDVVVATTNNY